VLQVVPSPKRKEVFAWYDYDKAGLTDARKLFIALANFTGTGREDKLKFAFKAFDEDDNIAVMKGELTKSTLS